MRQHRPAANQPELISPRTFRTKAERLNFIRIELDRAREARRLRKSGLRPRPRRTPPPEQLALFFEVANSCVTP
jgi:hypothetical protein